MSLHVCSALILTEWKQISEIKRTHRSKKRMCSSEKDNAMRGITHDILTILRAHHACHSVYLLCQKKTLLKDYLKSTFVKEKKNKKHNAKYYFSFCHFRANILHNNVCWMECYLFIFSFLLLFSPSRLSLDPWVVRGSFKAGTLRSVSTTLWIQ